MEQYISKSALVAEIERLVEVQPINEFQPKEQNKIDWLSGKMFAINSLRVLLDTLEVKEVDLEKIINDYFKDWNFDDELDIMIKPNNYSASFTDLKDIAKHFFELGLKAQKGEEYDG